MASKEAFSSCVYDVLTALPGHTISQRLRKLKQIPAELIPLGKHLQIEDLCGS